MPTQNPMTLAEADVLSEVYDLIAYVTDINSDNIFRGYQSREVLPSDDDFIIYTPLFKRRVGTNIRTFNGAEKLANQDGEYNDTALFVHDIQIDCYGENASAYATLLNVFSHSGQCRDWLISEDMDIRVCGCTDPQQMAIVDDTEQYVNRYMVTLSVCVDSAVSQEISWFDDVNIKGTTIDPATGKLTPPSEAGLVDVDVYFKP